MTARTSVEQSLAALVASDQSYSNEVLIQGTTVLAPYSDAPPNANPGIYADQPTFNVPSGYVVEQVIVRPEVGARAVIYKL